MKKAILAFPDIISLVDYTLFVNATVCEVIRTNLILICILSEADIELAKSGFNATVLE